MMTLGLNLKVSGYRIQSKASKREFKKILREIVCLIEMTPTARTASWDFPWYPQFWRRFAAWIIGRKHLPGLGGVGWTIVQPLVESFAVVDYWREHGHWFLVIGSCRPYSTRQVANYLRDNCGETEYQEGFIL